jgi:MtN3 and saliva related transmembrane protein
VKDLSSFSITYITLIIFLAIASGMFLWVIYGFIRSDPVIIGTNAAGFALNITLLAMKLRYDKMQKGSTLRA